MRAITFKQASSAWIAGLPTANRRRGPLSENTLRIYRAYSSRAVAAFGDTPLSEVRNSTIQKFVASLSAEGLSASTITGHIVVIKLAIESIRNDDGDCVFPIKLNHEFIGTPLIVREDQRAPCANVTQVEQGIAQPGWVSSFVALAAGAGLRISEIMALQIGDVPGDCISRDVVRIRETLKTPASKRDVYLPDDLAAFLASFIAGRSGPMFDVSTSTVYKSLEACGLPAPHSFRRFFVTARRKANMNPEVLGRLVGHSKGGTVTDLYSRVGQDEEFIRAEVRRCGLGFTLPHALRCGQTRLATSSGRAFVLG